MNRTRKHRESLLDQLRPNFIGGVSLRACFFAEDAAGGGGAPAATADPPATGETGGGAPASGDHDGDPDFGSAYDKANAMPAEQDDQSADNAEGTDKPEAGKEGAPPAKKADDGKPVTVESLQAKMQEQTQALQQWCEAQNEKLTKVYADLEVLNSPQFQQAIQIVQGKQPNGQPAKPGQAGDAAADPNAQPAATARPWKDYEPATDEEGQLIKWIDHLADERDGMATKFEAKLTELAQKFEGLPASIDKRLGPLEQRGQAERYATAEQGIRLALDEVKKDFADLVDGGEKEQELRDTAADLIELRDTKIERQTANGGKSTLKPLTLQEALTAAAKQLGYDTLATRMRGQYQKRSAASASARTEHPGRIVESQEADLQTQLAAAHDKADAMPDDE